MKYKFSIIVPIFNIQKYLNRCLDSLINQTIKEIQIILVNDGSEDNCKTICEEYASKDSRIKIINQANCGTGAARETGIKEAEGEYIIFIDPDDWVDLYMCEELYQFLSVNQCKVLVLDFNKVNDNNVEYLEGYKGDDISIENFYMKLSPCYVWNKVFHYSLKDKMLIGLDTKQAEDIALLLTIISKLDCEEDILYWKNSFYYYFQRSDSICRDDTFINTCGIYDYLRSMKYVLDNHNPKYSKYVAYYVANCISWGINNNKRRCYISYYNDFIKEELLQYIIGNYLLEGNSFIYRAIVSERIPSRIIYSNIQDKNIEEYCISSWKKYAGECEFKLIDIKNMSDCELPLVVKEQLEVNDITFVNEYLALVDIFVNGGIYFSGDMVLDRPIGELLNEKVFVSYISENKIGNLVWGSEAGNLLIRKVIETYKDNGYMNSLHYSLKERMQMVLENEYKLKPKGIECYLMNGLVKVFSDSKLYQRKDDTSIAHQYDELDASLGDDRKKYEKRWNSSALLNESNAIIEKYKEKIKKIENDLKKETAGRLDAENIARINEQAYINTINSTSWKVTKPIRLIKDGVLKWLRK